MASKNISKAFAVITASALLSLSTVQSAWAAPGPLATAPLYLSTIVEPNVYFTVDDSGSMDWNPVLAEGTGGLPVDEGLPDIDGEQRAYYVPQFDRLYNDRWVLPPADGTRADWDLGWMVRNHYGNLNYYNPSITYEPWPGTKDDGTPMYTDADPEKVLKDPFDPDGEWVDITRSYDFTAGQADDHFDRSIAVDDFWIAVYFIWDDTDGDGIIEQTDGRTRVVIPTDSPGELKNFANWLQYYRSRMNATKAIIGATINNTDASRMGMHMFNNEQILGVATMSDAANKRALLERFYAYDTESQGTPMRRGLEDVGQYFDNTGGSAPILSEEDGGECQQNFNILIGDGFWNGGDPDVGNTDRNGGSGDNNTPFDGNQDQSNDGGNYADSYSDTLADVAMWDYERDLRPDLDDEVPTQTGVDEADHQHLVTYTISFGPIGTLDPTVDDPLAAGFAWPDPDDGDAEKIDDMWHAAYNGRGQFLSANDPISLQTALGTAINDIAERTATAAAVSFNAAELSTNSLIFRVSFNTNRWQGDLGAFPFIGDDLDDVSDVPLWSAADELNARNIVTNPRVMLTHDGSGGVPFQWDDLSLAQKDDLKTDPAGGVDSDAVGRARLEYLRGDQSNEGTGLFFRERASLLADIVNSAPVFVGPPSLNWPDKAPFPTTAGERYSDFKNGPAKTRQGVVYSGSNGGMMHGFSATDGTEVIAYIANNLFSTGSGEGLHYLTDPNYVHAYYNDLTPSISDVYADLGTGIRQWETILIAGQRGGGQGIFALRITDPNEFSEANADKLVVWEFSSADDPDLGFTYSRPQIGLGNDGRWKAIFGNGYNDTGSGQAKLFILDIEGGADGSWDSGDITVISTGSGTPADRNGLAEPALADLDGNGTIDRVWAGDLKGQMWAFDLSTPTPSSTPTLLFTTIGNEPITTKPAVAKHPTISNDGSNDPNVMVYFGSGQYLVNADKTSTDVNYYYGVWDRGVSGLDFQDLVEQTYIPGIVDIDGNPVRVLTDNSVDYAGTEYGWFFELSKSGERSIFNATVRGNVLFFNTFIPEDDPCATGGGGDPFAVDLVNGGRPDSPPVDVNGDGVINEDDLGRDSAGNTYVITAPEGEGQMTGDGFIEDRKVTGDQDPVVVEELQELPDGRFSWQELIQ